jgi:hypothetical protein
MVSSGEFASSIESDKSVATRPQKKIKLARIAAPIEFPPNSVEIVFAAILHSTPHLLVTAE